MSSLHTKTKFISGDEVVVIAGKDLGKRGTLQKILKGNKAIVTGLNLVKKNIQNLTLKWVLPEVLLNKKQPLLFQT